MNEWIDEYARAAFMRVPPPPVLTKAEVESLEALFDCFDENHNGRVSFAELCEKGLASEDQCEAYQRDFDHDDSGDFDFQEFLDMMCPLGYRGSLNSAIGTLQDGTKVMYDPDVDYWRVS